MERTEPRFARPPGRSRLRAWSAKTGVVLVMASGGVLAAIAANWTYHSSWLLSLVVFFAVHRVAYVLSGVAGRMSVAASRYQAPDGRAIVDTDPRPPVLYLRAFTLDDHAAAMGTLGRDMFRTDEQRLGRAFAGVGPFLAIGRPGERHPPAGAARIYADETRWREEVTDLVARSALVVIAAGRGAGLEWEIELVMRTCDPRRTVLLLPFGAADYEDFRERSGSLFPKSVPVEMPGQPHTQGAFTAAIWFTEDWTAHLVRFAEGAGHTVELECLRLLGPVYEACGQTDARAVHARKQGRLRLGQIAFAVATLMAITVLIGVRVLPAGP